MTAKIAQGKAPQCLLPLCGNTEKCIFLGKELRESRTRVWKRQEALITPLLTHKFTLLGTREGDRQTE